MAVLGPSNLTCLHYLGMQFLNKNLCLVKKCNGKQLRLVEAIEKRVQVVKTVGSLIEPNFMAAKLSGKIAVCSFQDCPWDIFVLSHPMATCNYPIT